MASESQSNTSETMLAVLRAADRARPHTGTSQSEAAIFAATEKLLSTINLNEISVEQILAASGVSRRTFYVYFSSKHAVVAALLVRVMADIVQMTESTLDASGAADPDRILTDLAETAGGVWLEHGAVLRAVVEHWHDVPELRELWLGVIRQLTNAFAGYIDRLRAEHGVVNGVDSRKLAATLAWGCERAFYVAGLGVDDDIVDERDVMAAQVLIWSATIKAAVSEPS